MADLGRGDLNATAFPGRVGRVPALALTAAEAESTPPQHEIVGSLATVYVGTLGRAGAGQVKLVELYETDDPVRLLVVAFMPQPGSTAWNLE